MKSEIEDLKVCFLKPFTKELLLLCDNLQKKKLLNLIYVFRNCRRCSRKIFFVNVVQLGGVVLLKWFNCSCSKFND